MVFVCKQFRCLRRSSTTAAVGLAGVGSSSAVLGMRYEDASLEFPGKGGAAYRNRKDTLATCNVFDLRFVRWFTHTDCFTLSLVLFDLHIARGTCSNSSSLV